MDLLALFLKFVFIYGIVLMLVALGGMFSERSGIINIALEGIMVIGALAGVVANIKLADQSTPLRVAVSIIAAGGAGLIYSFLLAFASISLKADQTIGGTALNILATAIAMVIAKRVNTTTSKLSDSARLVYSYDGFVYTIFGVKVNIFLIVGLVLLIVSYVVLYKTRLGLRLRACGEHPQAADSLGINVYRMRYTGVLISGFLGGIGGLAYVLPANPDWDFKYGIAGMGFLALAVMIFGQWKPFKIFFAAMFFSIFKSLADISDSIPLLSQLHWPKEIYNMMPFIASMIVLTLTSKKSRAPKAEGIPYDKGMR